MSTHVFPEYQQAYRLQCAFYTLHQYYAQATRGPGLGLLREFFLSTGPNSWTLRLWSSRCAAKWATMTMRSRPHCDKSTQVWKSERRQCIHRENKKLTLFLLNQ